MDDEERDLWAYRIGRSVGTAFGGVREQMQSRVMDGAMTEDDLWSEDWWTEAADEELSPTLWAMYRDVAFEASTTLGIIALLMRDRSKADASALVENAARSRFLSQMSAIYGFGTTVAERVRLAVQGLSELTPGNLLVRLGLVPNNQFPGPLSPGIEKVVTDTTTNGGANGAGAAAFDVLLLEDEDGNPIGSGLVQVKRWVCMFQNSRETHMEAHDQEVGPGELFVVGGYECEYPGDPVLPPEEVINCQCEIELDVAEA
jgi:hypothetical protein